MKSKLRHLCIGSILLASGECCYPMNIRVSDMRLYGKPELWNQVNEQKKELADKNQVIEKKNREIEDLKEERKEFKEKIADLEALVQSLQEERKTKLATSELSRRESYDVLNNSSGIPVGESYDILNNSNSTLYNEEKETNGYSEFLNGSISPISVQKNLEENAVSNIPLPPPSTQKNSRENKAYLPSFSADKTVRTNTEPSIPLPPPLPPVLPSLNQNIKANIPPAPPPPPPVSPQISEKKSRGQNDTSLKFGEMRSSKDSQKLIESIWAIPRKNLHENLEIEQVAAKIVNIYLKNNPAKINSNMLSYREKIKNLEESIRR